MGRIVYHGTFAEKAPHEYDQPTFHVGTRKAAEERLAEAEELGGIATIYAYEIGDKAPTSRQSWEDPLDRWNPVPEHRTGRIYPYTNIGEDEGSTSYVIPTKFVGNHVKHLGPQFQEPRGHLGDLIADTTTIMSGGKAKKQSNWPDTSGYT